MTDQAPPAITTKITHIDGVEIIAREPAMAPHPHPSKGGKLVPYVGIEKIMLVDERETNMCECGLTGDNVRSLVAHRNSTHNRKMPHHPLHDEKVLVRLVQVATTERRRALRGYPQRTADEMNRLGLPTLTGKPWTTGMVTALYGEYKDKYPARPGRARTLRAVPDPRTNDEKISLVTRDGADVQIPQAAHDLTRTIKQRLDELHDLFRQLAAFTLEPDPEIVEKARRYDTLRETLGGSI